MDRRDDPGVTSARDESAWSLLGIIILAVLLEVHTRPSSTRCPSRRCFSDELWIDVGRESSLGRMRWVTGSASWGR
jgi:hypothetical protein